MVVYYFFVFRSVSLSINIATLIYDGYKMSITDMLDETEDAGFETNGDHNAAVNFVY